MRSLDKAVIILIMIALLVFFYTPGKQMRDLDQKVIILGFDALDYDLMKQWMDEGKLPNFAKVREMGTFSELGTTNPAESPVSWAAFSTGNNPGKTRIFDFLYRDPETYMPHIATVEFSEGPAIISLGGVELRAPSVGQHRRGDPLWNITTSNGIRTTVIQAPVTFPPDQIPGGKLLSGLGVPDIRGTQATFSYYATDVDWVDTEMGGKIVKVSPRNRQFDSIIYGPMDSTIPFHAEMGEDGVTISVQGQHETVREGEWSDWFVTQFRAYGIMPVFGIGQFHLNSLDPIELYFSPINFHPSNPVFDISYPKSFSRQLVGELGTVYKTLGWAIDTWALNEERIDEETFMEDLWLTVGYRENITLNELNKTDWNLFISVFQAPDRVQHLFWRYMDPEHPMYDQEGAKEWGDAIFQVYKRMDDIVGRALPYVDGNTTLIILSDHGFNPFRKAVNVNTWLVENGFMFLEGQSRSDYKLADLFGQGQFWPNVDWSRTEAYALGLGQIYINLKGREKHGAVEPGDYDRVRDDIIRELRELKDPETGESPIFDVYKREDIFQGPYTEEAGDLVVGFNYGYRVSWQTALGGIPYDVIETNMKKWSGDHCSIEPSITKGVLFISKEIDLSDLEPHIIESYYRPHITDIAPTVMGIFGIDEDMDGESLI
jgi:predicted AlkP superfamily phosphohydrolase/phosphomutase